MGEERRHTICNRDCPDACGIVATVVDGKVTQLQGDPDHPVTRGFLCHRTQQFLRTQYSQARLSQPLMRRAGELTPVSWGDALDHIATRLLAIRGESGPEAIFHYRSGGTLGMVVAQASELFFERFGPVTVKRGDICSGAGEAAQIADFGACDSSHLEDLHHSKNIILWGKNVYTSSPHSIPVLKHARGQGAELLLIDPAYHATTTLCQRWIQPRPGGDFALAMAAARVLFENDWIDAAAASYCKDLEGFRTLAMSHSLEESCAEADVAVEAAQDIAMRLHHGPTTILVGWGMARRRNGGAIVRALDALGAISGNVGKPGASVSYYFQRRSAFETLAQAAPPRTVAEPLFGKEVLAMSDPPIRAVWVTAGNPVAMLPDAHTVAAALRSRELVVVVDSWLSDTAAIADVVLPTTTLLEADDLLGAYGHHHIGEARPVVSPPRGVKSDLEIFQALAARVGLEDTMAGDATSWKRKLIKRHIGVSLEQLRDGALRNPKARAVVFEGQRFATDDGRAHLITQAPDRTEHDDRYPLTLLSLSTPKSQSSQWAKRAPRVAVATVHPKAAAGITNGALGELVSRVGSMVVQVAHDARQRRDVVIVPKGGHLRDGACANAITRARLTDIGEGGALYDEPVLLRPLSAGAATARGG